MKRNMVALACSLGLLVTLAPRSVPAQGCGDYSSHFDVVAGLSLTGTAFDVAVMQGDLVAVAAGSGGLHVVSVPNDGSTTLLGSVTFAADVTGIAAADQYAFLAAGSAGLQVVDLADPAQPLPVGEWICPGSASDLVLSGTIVYLAAHSAGLQLVDVSDPVFPAPLGGIDTDGDAIDVAVSGTFAYVADGSSGQLVIVDVSDPMDPGVRGTLALGINPTGVAVQGATACVVGDGELVVVDVLDPDAPAVTGSVSTPGQSLRVTMVGNSAYVADGTGDIALVDLSLPSTPAVTARLLLPGNIQAVVPNQGLLLAACGTGGLRIVSTGDNTYVSPLGSLAMAGASIKIAVRDNLVLAANSADGLLLVDVTDPAAPAAQTVWTGADEIVGIAVAGNLAFACTRLPHQLQILDITDPTAPVPVGSCALTGVTSYSTGDFGVAVSGDIVCVAGASAGLFVIDASDPSSPQVVATVGTAGDAADVAMDGPLAFVADRTGGLVVVDVSDPPASTVVTTYTGLTVTDVTAANGFAYFGCTDGMIHVIDANAPAAPQLLANTATCTNQINQISIAGSQLYASNGGVLAVIDISDAAVPVYRGGLLPEAGIGVIAAAPGRFCAVGGPNQLRLMPLECTGDVPTFLASFSARTVTGGVMLSWELTEPVDAGAIRVAGVAYGGLRAIPSRSDDGRHFEAFDMLPQADEGGVAAYILQLMGGDGIWRELDRTQVSLAPALQVRLTAPAPNPFRAAASVAFDLPAARPVLLAVYDLAGRRVRVLVDDTRPAGPNRAQWDGRDDAGRQQAAGTYLCRLESEGISVSRRLTLLR